MKCWLSVGMALMVFCGHANGQEGDALGRLISPLPVKKPAIGGASPVKEPQRPGRETVLPPSSKKAGAEVSAPRASKLKACPALVSGRVRAQYLPPVLTAEGCGDEAPLAVTKIGDVTLKPAVQMNCRMTIAVANWVEEISRLSTALLNQPLTTLKTASSYVCRRRNNRLGGKFSEHATMNALDIAGFGLANGKIISVLEDWPELAALEDKAGEARSRLNREDHPSTSKARFLRVAHAEACKHFTTVLGPDGDDYHKNHFHVDLGCHGKTCTWRLCQ